MKKIIISGLSMTLVLNTTILLTLIALGAVGDTPVIVIVLLFLILLVGGKRKLNKSIGRRGGD